MQKRRVAVLYTRALFGQGIAHLLQMDERLKVSCHRADLADTTERLKRLRPHAIVMEGRQESLLRETGRDLAPALFIEVHPQEDLMDIYRSRQVVAASPETLVEAICSASAKRTSG
jgi:DNA-binding NarL/FixJ family response regulator